MKITLKTLTVVSSLMLTACSGQKNDSYKITGTVDGLPDSTVITLVPVAHRAMDPVAEAMVIDGKFVFDGVAEEPIAVGLTVKDRYVAGRPIIVLDNSEMKITGVVRCSESEGGDVKYDFSDVKVMNSPLTDEYHKMMAPRYRLDSLLENNRRQYSSIVEEYGNARVAKNRQKLDSIEATEEFKAFMAMEHYCFGAFDSVLRTTVEQNRNTIWGPIALLVQYAYLTPEQRVYYESFSDSIKNSFHGRLVADEIYPLGRPGDKMPEFTAKDINGKEVNIASVCAGKKLVLLDFWASWCAPCRREIPNLKEIYKKHAADGFDIISVSIDTEEDAWKKAVADESLQWINICDRGVSGQYKVSAVPTMYLLDSNGCLVAENLRGEELAAFVDDYFSK